MPTTSAAGTSAPPAPSDIHRQAPTAGALLVVGFVLLSLNTRVAFGQIGPLAPVAHFGSATVTVLGLLPPLCMGLFAPLAPMVRRRLGEERGLLWASVVLVAGAILRMLGMPGLYAGTIVVSLATAVVNVLVPVFVRARFSHRHVGTMMGVYALSMGVGSAIVAALVAPVAQASGGSWQLAIGLAVVPAVLAAAGIAPQARVHRPRPTTPAAAAAAPRRHMARTALAWSLTAFFGIQALAFYTALAWLPSILIAAGTSRSCPLGGAGRPTDMLGPGGAAAAQLSHARARFVRDSPTHGGCLADTGTQRRPRSSTEPPSTDSMPCRPTEPSQRSNHVRVRRSRSSRWARSVIMCPSTGSRALRAGCCLPGSGGRRVARRGRSSVGWRCPRAWRPSRRSGSR
ncbi:MFS transporter [Kitasatospora cystarginea]|uniref:MFS transporter n=1 Tax=Kitasatospora cystarginea TaxID=58350 RepID=UPI0031D0CB13